MKLPFQNSKRGGTEVLPGVQKKEEQSPELNGMLLNRKSGGNRIGPEEISKAAEILGKYKTAKEPIENRIINEELWWELRHWEALRNKSNDPNAPKPTSAWLFNVLMNKHADAMDNIPQPIFLPREQSDEETAKLLSEVVPVIMEQNDYASTFSDKMWEKIKHGTAVTGTFWNQSKENGLGDIEQRNIDLLNIFWEPGITDIQDSKNLFIVDLVDNDVLNETYPEFKGELSGNTIEIAQYQYDSGADVDTSDKSVVVDWYYKVKAPNGLPMLHMAKFVGDYLLYASENDPNLQDTGLYEHGEYPVVFDTLFPVKGTPVGFGMIAVCKDPQMYIDQLDAAFMENAIQCSKARFFKKETTNINGDQFLDFNNPFVDVNGEISDIGLKQIQIAPMPAFFFQVQQAKIEELNNTSANRDVNNGGIPKGVTAAAAVAALQEAGNKVSRDMIAGTYRAETKITMLVFELMRQFYDFPRMYRITDANTGDYQFQEFSNEMISDVQTGETIDGEPLFRRPIFDIKIQAQRKNPFSTMEQNERAKELYGLGFFNPERAQEALPALDMMTFEGKEKIMQQIQQGATMLNQMQQMAGQADQLMQIVNELSGGMVGAGAVQGEPGAPAPTNHPAATESATKAMSQSMGRQVMASKEPKTSYANRLAKRSTPKM